MESKLGITNNSGADARETPADPITYTFDGRAFIVRPVFKNTDAKTVGDALLRLMRADFEQS